MGFLRVVGKDFFEERGRVDWTKGKVVGPVYALIGVEAIFYGGCGFG